MYIVTIEGADSSSHTQLVDAEEQKVRFEAAGNIDVIIVERETFTPTI